MDRVIELIVSVVAPVLSHVTMLLQVTTNTHRGCNVHHHSAILLMLFVLINVDCVNVGCTTQHGTSTGSNLHPHLNSREFRRKCNLTLILHFPAGFMHFHTIKYSTQHQHIHSNAKHLHVVVCVRVVDDYS